VIEWAKGNLTEFYNAHPEKFAVQWPHLLGRLNNTHSMLGTARWLCAWAGVMCIDYKGSVRHDSKAKTDRHNQRAVPSILCVLLDLQVGAATAPLISGCALVELSQVALGPFDQLPILTPAAWYDVS